MRLSRADTDLATSAVNVFCNLSLQRKMLSTWMSPIFKNVVVFKGSPWSFGEKVLAPRFLKEKQLFLYDVTPNTYVYVANLGKLSIKISKLSCAWPRMSGKTPPTFVLVQDNITVNLGCFSQQTS